MFVIRNDSGSDRLTLIERYINKLKKKLAPMDGYYGASAWQSTEREDETLVLVEFRQDRRGNQALRKFSKDKLAIEEADLSQDPVDVTVFDLEEQAGTRPSDAAGGSYLSISRRIASPGFGEELELELKDIFGSLATIPGYLGHIFGSHCSLPDRILGLVLWKSEEAFRQSLPESTPYQLRLYRKVL